MTTLGKFPLGAGFIILLAATLVLARCGTWEPDDGKGKYWDNPDHYKRTVE